MTPEKTDPRYARGPQQAHYGADPVRAVPPRTASVAGLVYNARIVTIRGLRPVQDLRAGDLVITRSSGVVAVERIEQQSLVTRAIYVIAGSIGHRHPKRDTLLPDGQPVLVRDWRARAFTGLAECVARADSLIDGEYVRDIGLHPLTLFRIYCARPQVLYADGMELGTADCPTRPMGAR
jgi:hypothetical protein